MGEILVMLFLAMSFSAGVLVADDAKWERRVDDPGIALFVLNMLE